MDWSNLGRKIADAAPLLGSALGPAGGAVGSLIANTLGTQNDPDAIDAAMERDPEAALKLRKLESEHELELKRMVLANEQSAREEKTQQLLETQATMRAELTAESNYRAGWRPMIGYVMAFSFGIYTLVGAAALLWAVIKAPEQVPSLVSLGFANFTAMGTVMGVNIARRSADKQAKISGEAQPGPIASLARRFSAQRDSSA